MVKLSKLSALISDLFVSKLRFLNAVITISSISAGGVDGVPAIFSSTAGGVDAVPGSGTALFV